MNSSSLAAATSSAPTPAGLLPRARGNSGDGDGDGGGGGSGGDGNGDSTVIGGGRRLLSSNCSYPNMTGVENLSGYSNVSVDLLGLSCGGEDLNETLPTSLRFIHIPKNAVLQKKLCLNVRK